MEQEYKWQLEEERFSTVEKHELVQRYCKEKREIPMLATYYDTPEQLLSRQGAALRLRMEDGRFVCCMKCGKKIQGGCTIREEYQVDAKSMEEGLPALLKAGAPKSLCTAVTAENLLEIARTEFLRLAYHLVIREQNGACEAELALDSGRLGCGQKLIPFSEMELEYLEGELTVFHAYATRLEKTFGLIIQPQSKLVRAQNVAQIL